MKVGWVLFVASRYIFKGRGSSPVLAVLGIAVGVLALIVIISVMNGFQLGFIESILEISSYHIRLESFPQEKTQELKDILLSIPGINAAVPFIELQAISRGRRTGQHAVLIRGIYEDTLEIDKSMRARLEVEEGEFDISQPKSVLLGAELSRRLGVDVGDDVTLFSITGILTSEDEGGFDTFTVKGIFRTGYYEYDLSWAFINIDSVSLLTSDSDIKLGVKIANRFHDRTILEQVKRKLSGWEGIKFSSWREYNRSFFGALRTEKLFMFILVGLIFIVVGLNIFQGQRRAVLQRREEIGLLRAVGGSQKAVRFVFVCDGAIIGLTGALCGLVTGLAIALNIQNFFSLIENVVNKIIGLLNTLAGILGAGWMANFSVFSPQVFYIKEIPSRVLPGEVAFIFMFGLLSALAASWAASRKISKIQPAEVLRY
ncbi:MAG: ABC transporter permease, partial [Treponema sp.]|nr:ABC transporter permease [Treponema sp.]